MARHLKACWEQHNLTQRGKAAARWFHLAIQGRYGPSYWLHLQAPAKATFGELDGVLRRVWLECCDHLSAFEFPVKRVRLPRNAFGDVFDLSAFTAWAPMPMAEDSDRLMEERLSSKLRPGVVFHHQYDFGTTTELALRVVDEHTAPAIKGNFKLLARNDPPTFPCSVCGKPATRLCQACEPGQGDLCDACADQHDCSPEMLVLLVNSPRTGVCGYCGPSVEP